MRQHHSFALLQVIILTLVLGSVAIGRAQDFTKPEELVLKSEAVFKSFMADPGMDWFRQNVKHAKGIFIVPQMIRGGMIIGGSGGSGVLLAQDYQTGNWSYPAFYTIGSVSFGLQIGADVSEIILMVMTTRGIEAMLSTEFKLGGDVALAAGPVGGSAKAQVADILAYGRSKGAFGGVTVEGALIQPDYEANNIFYSKDILPVDILFKRNVSNEKADALRAALPERGRNVQKLGIE